MKLTIAGKSGSLHQFVRKVKNSKGQVVLYPKIKGSRNINKPQHWQWQITWKDKVDDRFVSQSMRVPPAKANIVKKMILQSLDIKEIQTFLRS